MLGTRGRRNRIEESRKEEDIGPSKVCLCMSFWTLFEGVNVNFNYLLKVAIFVNDDILVYLLLKSPVFVDVDTRRK